MHVMVKVAYSVKGFRYEEQFGINVPKAASAEKIKQMAHERCKGIVSTKKGCSQHLVYTKEVTVIN